jgi:hypothetical protein
MSTIQATIDLSRFTSRQLSNIKSYYTSGSVGGESTTKLIARSLWDNYAPKNHPHIISEWSYRVKNYPADHIIWTEFLKILVLSKLLPENDDEYSSSNIQHTIDRIEEGIKKGEPFSSDVQSCYNEENKDLKAMVKAFVKKAIVPMPADNEGLIQANKMVSGEITTWSINYVEESESKNSQERPYQQVNHQYC